MGNAAGGIEQAEGQEARSSVGAGMGMSEPTPALQKKQPAPPKLPMPSEEELGERFNVVLVSDRRGGEESRQTHINTQTHHTLITNVDYCAGVK